VIVIDPAHGATPFFVVCKDIHHGQMMQNGCMFESKNEVLAKPDSGNGGTEMAGAGVVVRTKTAAVVVDPAVASTPAVMCRLVAAPKLCGSCGLSTRYT
jgi:hypothetical protein